MLCSKKYDRRPGTADEGRDFENLIIANLALNLTLDKKVKNFDIKSNVNGYGAFDDVVFDIATNESNQKYCMQLKYKHCKKKTLPKHALNEKSGNYSLTTYCQDYHKIVEEKKISFIGVLWVRAKFGADENEVLSNGVCNYRIKRANKSDKTTKLCKSLDKHCVCYHFLVEESSKEVTRYKQFFDNFVLCVTNSSTSNIEKDIKNTFETKFFQSLTSASFLELIKNFNKQCYSLEKCLVNCGITLSLLETHMVDLGFETQLTESKKLLVQAILENGVTHLKSINNLEDFGQDTKKQVTKDDAERLAKLFKFDQNNNNKLYSKALWLSGKCALVVCNNSTVQAAIQLSPNLKYILIDKTPTNVKNVKNFTNLQDLEQFPELYKQILQTFDCQLQNQTIRLEKLVELDLKIAGIISTNELLAMADKQLHVAEIRLELPKPHISPRHLRVTGDPLLTVMSERDIIKSESKICIISAAPGMGKTTIARSLAYTSKPNLWTLYLNARDLSTFLRSKQDDLEEFRQFILDREQKRLSEFECILFKIFLDKDAIRFLWDALDEINEINFANIKSLIKQLQNKETVHYITTRPHLASDLECSFQEADTRSLTLTEFDEDEQRYYVQHRLNLTEDDVEEIYSKIKANLKLSCYENILGIPLQIYMITELLKQKRVTGQDINHQNFTINKLYAYFIHEKLKMYFVEKLKFDLSIDYVGKIIEKEITEYVTLFQRLSIQLYFDQKDLEGFDLKCDPKMLLDIKKNGDVTGFITNDTNRSQFFHNSVSEFFAAQYLAENLENMKNLEAFYFGIRLNNIRFFFDLILAEHCSAHIAILHKNWELLGRCTAEDLQKTDRAGRNAFQMLILVNKEAYAGNHFSAYDDRINLYTSLDICNFRTQGIDAMLQTIRGLVSKVDLFAKNILFGLDTFDYLDKRQAFLTMGVVYAELKTLPMRLIEIYRKDIIVSCLLYDYSDILDVLEVLPKISTDLFNNFEQTLLYYKCANWIGKLTLSKALKCKTNFDFSRMIDGANWTLIFASLRCNSFHSYYTFAQKVHQIIKLFITILTTSIIDKKNCFGETLLITVSKFALSETVELLLKSGADIQLTDDKGKTALHQACECTGFSSKCRCRRKRVLTVKHLLEHGALVNARTNQQETPLHFACSNSLDVVKLLLQNNADINACDDTKCTVLHHCCKYQHASPEMLEFIVENGVLVNCRDTNDDTPLHFAVLHCDSDLVIDCLIKSGASGSSVNKNGATPLDNAYRKGYQTKIEMLLRNQDQLF